MRIRSAVRAAELRNVRFTGIIITDYPENCNDFGSEARRIAVNVLKTAPGFRLFDIMQNL